MENKKFDLAAINKVITEILLEPTFIHDMYTINVTPEAVREEIETYVPQLMNWCNKYLLLTDKTMGANGFKKNQDFQITRILDIEENLWSPRYGLKGKIDCTVEVKLHNNRKPVQMPLELKTGRASHSAEHKGQVTLYSMIGGDRRSECGGGLLTYLKTAETEYVKADYIHKRGLVQLRNELAYYMKSSLKDQEKCVLPEPINNERSCTRCSHLVSCSIYQQEIEKISLPERHAMVYLVPTTLSHLTSTDLAYFSRWCRLVELEMAATMSGGQRSKNSDIWCQTSWNREKQGVCFSGMLLKSAEKQKTSYILHRYGRVKNHQSNTALDRSGLAAGASVVLSAEEKPLIALAQGTLMTVTTEYVEVLLDRLVLMK